MRGCRTGTSKCWPSAFRMIDPGLERDGVLTPHLHERFPDLAESLPHLVLSERPTPVRELRRLGIWVKEDGDFGSGGWGGNKVRKLEWLIPDAQRRGRRSILTFGGLGTNWGLATALYAREHGLET